MDFTRAARQAGFSRVLPWVLGGALALGLLAAAFSFRLTSSSESLDLEARGRLVVLPIKNATGEHEQDWIRLGLTEMVAETLSRTRGVEVVTPDRLPAAVKARGLDPDDPEMRRRIRGLARELGGELVVDVTARRRSTRRAAELDPEPYALELQVLDQNDAVVGSSELRGDDLARLGDRLTGLLADALTLRTEAVRMRDVYSASPFLNRLFGMGLAARAESGAEAARPHFEIVLAAEPRFLAARIELAECERLGGRFEEGHQMLIETLRDAQNRGERAWEVRILRALALAEAIAGRSNDAVGLATQVRSLVSDGKHGRPLEVLALRDLARFALADGQEERGTARFREALELERTLGDRLGQLDTLGQLGALALAAPDLDTAEKYLTEARDFARELGDVWAEMRATASLGEVAARRGESAEAVELWRRALTFYEQRGDDARRLLLGNKLAEALLLAEDWEAAEKAFLDVLDLAVARQDEAMEAQASLRLAFILLRRGYPYQARPHLDRALALDSQLDEPLTLQRLIAWMAYEEGSFDLAYNTLSVVKRQAGDSWRELDDTFLEIFATARDLGERQPLPWESGVLGPG